MIITFAMRFKPAMELKQLSIFLTVTGALLTSVRLSLLLAFAFALLYSATVCASIPTNPEPDNLPNAFAESSDSLQKIVDSDEWEWVFDHLEAGTQMVAALSEATPNTLQCRSTSGIASVYADKFHNRRTANGQRFNIHKLTAAHKHLPFGTRVLVRSKVTNRVIEVVINDRGPFIAGRIIDLSPAAARAIGLRLGPVEVIRLNCR